MNEIAQFEVNNLPVSYKPAEIEFKGYDDMKAQIDELTQSLKSYEATPQDLKQAKYTRAKLNAFRKAIQEDLARNNIKITDVCPGLIQTDFYVRANNELPKEVMNTGLTSEDVAKTVKYVFDLPHEITIPSIEVRHIKNY